MMSQTMIIEGRISIRATLESKSRPIYTIYIQKDKAKQYASLMMLAKHNDIPMSLVDSNLIANLADGQSHGGIVAVVGERRYVALAVLAKTVSMPFVVMLDGIEDPYNFGQVIRALYVTGAHGVVVRRRNWLSAVGIVTRSSAGTSERIAIAQVDSPLEAIRHFKQRGYGVVCTANQRGARTVQEANLKQPLFVFIGGERRGASRRILRDADFVVRIPYVRPFSHALGVTAAASIIAFEVARQRGLTPLE